MKRFLFTVILFSLAAGWSNAAGLPKYTIKEGHIGPCLTQIAVPAKWNGNLLIIAHGKRAEDQPLSAKFTATDLFPGKLIQEGWLVACSSYRRNGWIVGDAIDDLHALIAHVKDQYGKPKHIYIVGSSMGGMIAIRMAESSKEKYDGILAIGAAISWTGSDPRESLDFSPESPILFLSNENELDGPRNYLAHVMNCPVSPALWHVRRDGHCNVTGEESLSAFRALIQYHDTGRIAKDKDATIVPKTPRSVAVYKDGKAFAKVSKTGYNFDTEFVAADLAKMGITKGSYFTVRHGDKNAKVFFGVSYSDVSQGQWVAFLTAEGYLKIARNYADASSTLGCEQNDIISIEPLTSSR